MTESPDPKKRAKKGAKKHDAEHAGNAEHAEPPPSDPTLSDRTAGAHPTHNTNDDEPHDAETFDVPVSGFFEGDKADNDRAADSDPPLPPLSDEDDFEFNRDVEATVNLTGDELPLPGRDDLEEPTHTVDSDELPEAPLERVRFQQAHLRGAIEALVFASDAPLKANELARRAHAPIKEVKEQLLSLKSEYGKRGIHLDEIAGGWVFRTSPEFAPFVRELTKEKPVRLTRAQLETLAILAYRQPITRPEIDDIRGVDSGPVLKLLLERDLIRILGKKEEAGRPILYGTTSQFLEFFGLKSLKDLPTLTEFTELNEDSRRVVEEELGESLETIQEQVLQKQAALDLETTRDEEMKPAEEPATREIEAVITDIADTAEHPLKHSRDTVTNEAELTDEELYPDDKDEDFDDDDDDDDDDEDKDDEDDSEQDDEEPEK